MAIKSQSSQKFVPIKDIRDGIVILKSGGMRMVLLASSINFALKSVDEQNALLLQFQNFLNSLEFTTQIVIQSRRLDIKPYLATLQERLQEQTSDLMRIQTMEYIDFIQKFTDTTNVMTKTFFIVVPYTPKISLSPKQSITDSFLKTGNKEKKTPGEIDIAAFEEAKTQLEQRANVVRQGLARTGVRVVKLGTEGLVELYYKLFNPSDAGVVNIGNKE